MRNVMLGFPNLIDLTTLYGGGWQATLPLTNLQTTELGAVARSVDCQASSTTFDVAMDRGRKVLAFALVNHNLSLDATVRLQGSNVADFSAVEVDSGEVEVWPVVYPIETVDFEDEEWWSGKYTEAQRAGYTWTFVLILDANAVFDYWRVAINDPDNANGFVEVGRVFLGPAWQPSVNFIYGDQLGWTTDTKSLRARSGADYFDRRTPRRSRAFRIEDLPTDEAFANAFELMRQAGIDQEILYIEDPDDTVHALRRRFLGRFATLSPIEHPYFEHRAANFSIEERL